MQTGNTVQLFRFSEGGGVGGRAGLELERREIKSRSGGGIGIYNVDRGPCRH